jgi:Delta24(24(1))-sterol reductase
MPLYMWMSLEFYRGSVFFGPKDWRDGSAWSNFVAGDLLPKLAQACPTAEACAIYAFFLLTQVFLFFVCPGIKVIGLPVPSENNRRLVYHCNAFTSWIVTLLGVFSLYYSGIFSIGVVSRLRGQLIVVSMVTADVIALVIYVSTVFFFKSGYKLTGNHFYDFFMGACLNPRIGSLDLKLWAEVKMSWVTLFLLVLGSAVGQYETLGGLTNGMVVIVFAQLLYSNACMKGEECVCTTWDIFAEKWGWMLIYWNFCGVPFVYSFQAEYLSRASAGASLDTVSDISTGFAALLCAICFAAYYVWDASQQQKNTYRLMQRGEFKARKWWAAFPQLPGGILHRQYGSDAWKHCRVLTFDAGDNGKRLTLLVDGVWKYGRKIHYGMDIIMALVWAVSTVGASGDGPYMLNFFYPLFFTSMIIHRWQRDDHRCREKYGDKNWSAYCKEVPYVFFPGLY